jgi:hypothetical protein
MRKQESQLTVSEPLSTTLKDGRVVHGTLWLHPSRRGSFEVEYHGERKTDGRADYTNIEHIRSIARIVLTELAGGVAGSSA